MPTWLIVITAALVLVGASVLAMAVGVIFRRPCLRGSCGGPALQDVQGNRLSCETCPNRGKHGGEDAAKDGKQYDNQRGGPP